MKPELLMPAGCRDSAISAINGGADAIYLGAKKFNARVSATNFDDDEIISIIDYALLRGVKVYITINTLYSTNEIPRVLEFVNKMYANGASAFIVQDIGIASLLKSNFSDINLHASTQMTIHSVEAAIYMKNFGFSRVILSRELSLEEIAEISKEVETEVFAHGAMCYSYSGQCYLSSIVGARSGNRGKCAQPCRLTYSLEKDNKPIKSGHLLSPKDMNTLEILEEITQTGVTAIKIEGRMKSPEYVYIVAKAYRERLDTGQTSNATLKDVLQIFNRGGSFSTGHYKTYNSAEMMSITTPKSTGVFCGVVNKYEKGKCTIRFNENMVPGDGIEIWVTKGKNVGCGINREINKNDTAQLLIEGAIEVGNHVYKSYDKKLNDEAKKGKAIDVRKTMVTGRVECLIGNSIKITLKTPLITTEYYGTSVIEEAKKAPMKKDDILKQLCKTGNSPFIINFNEVLIDENIFISKQSLNEARRGAITALENDMISAVKKPLKEPIHTASYHSPPLTQKLTVMLKNAKDLNEIKELNISRVYVDLNNENIKTLKKLKNYKPEIFLTLPGISRNKTENELKNIILGLEKDTFFHGYLVANYGQLNMLKSSKKKIALDHSFNIFNNEAKNIFDNHTTTLSMELTANQLKKISGENSEIIIHGRQRLMTTHHCPIGLYDAKNSCSKNLKTKPQKNHTYTISDRTQTKFPLITDCAHCTTYMLNSKTLDTSHRFDEIISTGIEFLRLMFNTEDVSTIKATTTLYCNLLKGEKIVVKKNINATNGHFFRGVD